MIIYYNIQTRKIKNRRNHGVFYSSPIVLRKRAVNITRQNYGNGLLEWTTRLTFFVLFVAYNQIPLPVNLHPALDHTVKVSSISLHEPPHIFKLSSTTDEHHVIVIATREGSLCPTHVKVLAYGTQASWEGEKSTTL